MPVSPARLYFRLASASGSLLVLLWFDASRFARRHAGVPNYLEIITRPMDLGTIKKSMDRSKYPSHELWAETLNPKPSTLTCVDRSKYPSHELWADDVRQVWANAMSFNAPGRICGSLCLWPFVGVAGWWVGGRRVAEW